MCSKLGYVMEVETRWALVACEFLLWQDEQHSDGAWWLCYLASDSIFDRGA